MQLKKRPSYNFQDRKGNIFYPQQGFDKVWNFEKDEHGRIYAIVLHDNKFWKLTLKQQLEYICDFNKNINIENVMNESCKRAIREMLAEQKRGAILDFMWRLLAV